jgi:DNA-directed RNA polymerase subunit RPC12/RpoP
MWKCSKCGEEVEELFDVCWNCGTTSDGVEDPNFDKARRARQLMSSSPELDIAAAHETEQREAMERSWKGEKRRPCPDCGAPLSRISLNGNAPGEAGGPDSGLAYAAEPADRGWFRGAIPASGTIHALACPDCGRVLLFAARSQP